MICICTRLAAMKALISILRNPNHQSRGPGRTHHSPDTTGCRSRRCRPPPRRRLHALRDHLCLVLEPMGVTLQDVYMHMALPSDHAAQAVLRPHPLCSMQVPVLFRPDPPPVAQPAPDPSPPPAVRVSSHRHDVLAQPTKMRCPEVIIGADSEWGPGALYIQLRLHGTLAAMATSAVHVISSNSEARNATGLRNGAGRPIVETGGDGYDAPANTPRADDRPPRALPPVAARTRHPVLAVH